MSESPEPYEKYAGEDLILRDHLAIDRTVLANERTLLAYVRTALAVLVVGGTLLKFFDTPLARTLGYAAMVIAIILGVVGAIRYYRMGCRIAKARPRR